MTETKQSKSKKAKPNTELKLSTVVKKAKQAHATESYELPDGSTIKFYPIFPDLMIEEMYEEHQKHVLEMNEKGIELSDKMTIYFINLMMIKYFTHFKKSMPDTILGEGTKPGLLDYINHFADTGLMKIIIDEIFLPDQKNKVLDKMTDIFSASQIIDEIQTKTQQKVANFKFKNKEVFEKFNELQVENNEPETNNVSNVLADK